MSDKRKRLLKSALALFVEQGFQGTPTSQVASHAGVATGTLFHHFDSKTELIHSVYQYCIDLREDAVALESSSQSVEQKFKNLFLKRIEWGASNLSAFTFIGRYENSEFLSPELPSNKGLCDLISEGQGTRKLRPIDEELMLRSVESSLDCFTSFYSQNADKRTDQLHFYASFDFFWTSIKY